MTWHLHHIQCLHLLSSFSLQATDEINKLHSKESWVLDTDDSSGSRTQLPTIFEHSIMDAVRNLNNVITKVKADEQDIFNDRSTQEQATSLFIKAVEGTDTPLCAHWLYHYYTRDIRSFSCSDNKQESLHFLILVSDLAIPVKYIYTILMKFFLSHVVTG